jgi:iron complex outermembrane receptor protein
MAQDEQVIEEVVTVGTRSAKPRSASDSTVPIDVISGEDFNALGNSADLTDNLRAMVPSYTATPATGDGSAFVRPTSLRGTAPDQSLVLVNGKRRHRSALVQFFAPAAGNGAHGVDIGMIPGIAVKSVEVLRDGAAAQYGSDAIAGVINFVMKDASEGGSVQLQYGEFVDGEQSLKFGANGGIAVGDSGFINASIEYVDNDALSRGIQRISNQQALLDAGVPLSEIGADAPFGDQPFLQTWGRPQTEGVRFFLNSGFDISDRSQLYARLGVADTDGRYRFFYRDPAHSSLTDYRAQGYTGLRAGYTPFLDGEQTDTSLVVGIDGEFESGMTYDFSYGFGKSELDYYLNNTVNSALALVGTCPACEMSQMDFYNGGYNQEETNLNADFSLPMSDNINLAWGVEWREESYTVKAGEPNASESPGSSGFRGITEEDSGQFDRDNVAIYADIEHDITDALLLQYAIRYENFSDFGSTTNGKIAGRFRFTDSFALRGAVSTGFHAPTPGQANVRTTITTFDGVTGLQVEEGLIPPTSPAALQNGGAPLKEEESLNYSLGFTADFFENTTVTLDVYQIEVDDRIYRTGDILTPNGTISFYTNALDVEHSGLDLVVTSGFEWGNASGIDLTLAYGYNQIDVTGQTAVNGVNPVSDSLVEDIENNYPEHRWVLTGNTYFGEKLNLLARINYNGEHYDERGTIAGDVDPVSGAITNRSALLSSTAFLDLELGYQLNDNWRVALGGMNVTDEFPDTISDGGELANRISVGLQYPRRTVANYEGASWYLKGVFSW